MKKTLLTLSIAMMTLSACTQSEVVEEGVQSNAIGFDNIVSKNTRALSKDNFVHFWVFGSYKTNAEPNIPIVVFNGNTLVTKTGGEWGYSDTRYWAPNSKYHFAAFSCENSETLDPKNLTAAYNTEDINNPVLNINGYICNSNHNHDLVYAEVKNTDSEETGPADNKVKFDFKHILSRVNVKFESDFAAGYDLEISDVKIVNVRDKADYSNREWKKHDRTANDPQPFVELKINSENKIASAANGDVPAKSVESENAFVIPFKYEQFNVKLEFTLNIYKDGKKILPNRKLSGSFKPTWNIGTSYTYVVRITGTAANLKPIVFTTGETGLEGWTSGTDDVEFNFASNVPEGN